MSFEREIVGGRISGERKKELGIRGGMPVGEALTRLRELRERYNRYRHYSRNGSPSPTAGLETLRYKTGWILAAVMKDGSLIQPSFEFAESVQRSRGLPRSNDHIRTTEAETVHISEFGARGEALRERRPSLRHLSVSDDTGTEVNSGATYTVADVQLETLPGENRQFVWLRLVAR